MFTGIVEGIGTVGDVRTHGEAISLVVACGELASGVQHGDSVCVNGVCLTATRVSDTADIVFDAVKETVSRSTVGMWSPGMRVNIERSVTPQTRMGGHIVQGHVDGTARVTRIERRQSGLDMFFEAEPSYWHYVVEKGSIAVDGVSLTVAEMADTRFRIAVVPYTLEHTNLASRAVGDKVNVETDVLGRYVLRLLAAMGKTGKGVDLSLLAESGFLTKDRHKGRGGT